MKATSTDIHEYATQQAETVPAGDPLYWGSASQTVAAKAARYRREYDTASRAVTKCAIYGVQYADVADAIAKWSGR